MNMIFDPVFMKALWFTLQQAFLSASLSIFVALIGACGYARLYKSKKLVRSLLILPQIISPTIVVLSLLVTFKNFPYGLWGVVLGNALLNAGFCLLTIGEKWKEIESQWLKLSKFFGANYYFFLKKILFPLVMPYLARMFVIVFAFCLSGLVIPLVLGGGPQASTLEVLVYEKIKSQGLLTAAFVITVVQWLIQLIVFYFLLALKNPGIKNTKTYFQKNNSYFSKFITYFLVLTICLPFYQIFKTAMTQINSFDLSLVVYPFINSIFISVAVAVLTMFFVSLYFFYPKMKRLLVFPPPSQIFIGVLVIILWGAVSAGANLQIFLILSLAYFAYFAVAVLRMVSEPLQLIVNKFEPVLKIYNANKFFAFFKVYWPQTKNWILFSGIIAFCWAFGEFTIASLVAPQSATVPLLIQDMMSQYRLEMASALGALTLIVGFLFSYVGESFIDGIH